MVKVHCIKIIFAGIAQLVEQGFRKAQVGSSSLSSSATYYRLAQTGRALDVH